MNKRGKREEYCRGIAKEFLHFYDFQTITTVDLERGLFFAGHLYSCT
jgi:hypothetical protein